MQLSLSLNGSPCESDIEPALLLIDYIREHQGLTGTHMGCDTGQCGACTVMLDQRAVKSCLLLASQAHGRAVTTIEGVAPTPDTLHPLQEAFRASHALQCGFCTPGMIMTGLEILRRTPNPSEDEIREQLEGNLCRCTGYQNIVQALKKASKAMQASQQTTPAEASHAQL